MERMAKVYLSEGNLEDAYILYLRFSTLFLEKMLEHPEYKSVPAAMKQQNRARLKEILGILEEVKKRLMQQYNKDYAAYLVKVETDRLRALELEKSRAEEKERERQEQEEKQRRRRETDPSFIGYSVPPSAPSAAELLDNIVYPNDFPSDKNRTPSTGLILPNSDPTKKPSLPPSVDRTLKPSTSYNDGGLRTVVVPKDTMYRFLMLVSGNTAKNIETCGILAGRLAQNQFLITHVIIPKQKGTPDSCNTMHEEELFDVQDQHNLITLGWIHVSCVLFYLPLTSCNFAYSFTQTHPSQTAFLSSVDLHTHCSYQLMLPEALAIVCAPKYQTNGFFCLTPSYGLEYIASCRLEGFHPHPADPALFMEAGHYCLDESRAIEVVDLRI